MPDTSPSPSDSLLLRFPLEDGRSIEVRLPVEYSRSDFEYLRQQLALAVRAIDETTPTDVRAHGRSGYLERWCVVEPGE